MITYEGTFKFECADRGAQYPSWLFGGDFTVRISDGTQVVEYKDANLTWFAEVPSSESGIEALLELIRIRSGFKPKYRGGLR